MAFAFPRSLNTNFIVCKSISLEVIVCLLNELSECKKASIIEVEIFSKRKKGN